MQPKVPVLAMHRAHLLRILGLMAPSREHIIFTVGSIFFLKNPFSNSHMQLAIRRIAVQTALNYLQGLFSLKTKYNLEMLCTNGITHRLSSAYCLARGMLWFFSIILVSEMWKIHFRLFSPFLESPWRGLSTALGVCFRRARTDPSFSPHPLRERHIWSLQSLSS